jgi:hypothetical protein
MKKDSKLVNTVYDRVLRRELGNERRYSKVRGIYGDRKWIDNLDIVNELGGHSGCVNALRLVFGFEAGNSFYARLPY